MTIEISDKLALRPLTPKLGAALTDVKLADDMSDELSFTGQATIIYGEVMPGGRISG